MKKDKKKRAMPYYGSLDLSEDSEILPLGSACHSIVY